VIVETAATVDPYDVRYATHATGLLQVFNRAGVLTTADVHVAATLGRLTGETDQVVQLAAALAVRAVRLGSVCVELSTVSETATAEPAETEDLSALPWPAPSSWLAACAASPMVAVGVDGDPNRPVRLVDGLLYLDRFWRQEQLVRADLDARSARLLPPVDLDRLRSALTRLLPGAAPDRQRLAAAAAATGWMTVIAGGPGTGKTTTVAKLLAVLRDQPGAALRIALAAPTGKAAARMQEAVTEALADPDGSFTDEDRARVGAVTASTLHRLLGRRPDSHSRFKHDRTNRLPYDAVIVDETSMVSLTLMSRLLEAVRPDARVVLVGDPDQLASVEAGAVLGDLVQRSARPDADDRLALLRRLVPDDLGPGGEVTAGLGNDVVRLTTVHRFGEAIGQLAAAVRAGDPPATLARLRGSEPHVRYLEHDSLDVRAPAGLEELRRDVVDAGQALVEAATTDRCEEALSLLERHRLLCAHREGPYGVARWTAEVERWLTSAIDGYGAAGEWYVGRPLLVTANDYELKLYNGDTGVVVQRGSGLRAVFRRGAEVIEYAPSRLSTVQTVHAMTVHRAQGSQFDRVSLLLPPVESRVLTRELFYTAVTRAKAFVRVIGSEDAIRSAVTRPVVRASGLRRR